MQKRKIRCHHLEVNETKIGMICARCGDILAKTFDELVRKRLKRVKRT